MLLGLKLAVYFGVIHPKLHPKPCQNRSLRDTAPRSPPANDCPVVALRAPVLWVARGAGLGRQSRGLQPGGGGDPSKAVDIVERLGDQATSSCSGRVRSRVSEG